MLRIHKDHQAHLTVFFFILPLLFSTLLISCNYSSNQSSTAIPTDTLAAPSPTQTRTLTPEPTNTSKPKPSATSIPYSDLGREITINGVYFVGHSTSLEQLFRAKYGVEGSELQDLVDEYGSLYDVENIQEGRFYRLPEFDEQGNMKDGEDKPLEVRLGNYDRTETIKGMGEFPVYELGMNESVADVLILPLDDPGDQDGYRFDIRRFNFNTGNVGGIYINRENELMNAPRNPLTIGALGYDSMEDFMNADEEEILRQIRLTNAWDIDVSAYGWTNLALVFRDDGGEEIVPFIIDKEVQPTQEPSNGGGNGGGETPIPTRPPKKTPTPHG